MGNCLPRYRSRLPIYDDGRCAICLESHVIKSKPECGHVFCFQCLVKWCRVKLECPTCKQPFTEFHNQAIGSPENGKFDQKYRPGPPAAPSASNRRTTRSEVPTIGRTVVPTVTTAVRTAPTVPTAVPTVSTRRTVRFQNNGVTFTVTAENFIEVLINENLVVNNVAQAQARYNLLGIIIAEVERVRAGESRPYFTSDNVRLLPKLFTCRQKYRMMLRI